MNCPWYEHVSPGILQASSSGGFSSTVGSLGSSTSSSAPVEKGLDSDLYMLYCTWEA